jgi:hypothetical protein
VLQECGDLQLKKANDYQNPNSNIKQADYYPRGVASLLDIVHAKTLRMMSVVEAMENDPEYSPNFESLEDSAKDLINYSSFIAAYLRGGIDGQSIDRDFLNRRNIEPVDTKRDGPAGAEVWAGLAINTEADDSAIRVSGVPYSVSKHDVKFKCMPSHEYGDW